MSTFLGVLIPIVPVILTLALVAAIWLLYVVNQQNKNQPYPGVAGVVWTTIILILATGLTAVLLVNGKATAGWVSMAAIGGILAIVAPPRRSSDHSTYLIRRDGTRNILMGAGAGLTIVGSVVAAVLEIVTL